MADVDDFNTKIIEEFRANGGKVGGGFEGAPVLLLTTGRGQVGEDPGEPDDVPGPRATGMYVFASKAGAPTNPDWYHNLVAHPEVTVEDGHRALRGGGHTGRRAERDRSMPSRRAATRGSPSTRRRPTGSSRWWRSNAGSGSRSGGPHRTAVGVHRLPGSDPLISSP